MMLSRITPFALLLALAAVASPLRAQDDRAGDAPDDSADGADDLSDRRVTIGIKAGLYVPGLVSEMGLNGVYTLEVGGMLPFADRRIGIIGDVSYAGPGSDGSMDDPRIGDMGGTWSYEATTHQLFVSVGPLIRFLPPGSTFVPYVGVYARYYMMKTVVNGDGNEETFGENEETSDSFGFGASLGGELRAGPGVALLDVSFGWAPLEHRITGDVSTGALGIQLGYRFML